MKIYTVWDDTHEREVVGTLTELDDYFEGYCRIMFDEETLEVTWDNGWEDGPYYWQYGILKIEETDD